MRFYLLLFFVVLLFLNLPISMAHSVTCQHVDFLWNSNNCCEDENTQVNCLEYIPKMDLELRFTKIEQELYEIKSKLKTLLDSSEITTATIDM